MDNSAERSNILLLNLGLDTDKTAIKKVGVKELKEVFEEYGQLKKIIVFTKKVLLKAFLEYEELDQAENAKNKIHDTIVRNYGKARLYFSPMRQLEFSNKYLEFWEAKSPEKSPALDDDASTKHSFKNSLSKFSNQFSLRKENSKNALQQSGFPHKNDTTLSDSTDSFQLNFNKNHPSKKKHSFESVQHSYSFALTSTVPNCHNQQHRPNCQPRQETGANFGVMPSKVVLVSNLGYVFKNTDELFNIFSAFGNIAKILYMVNLQKAMVEYTHFEYASESIVNINDLTIGETKLRVSFSKHQTINLENNNKNENSTQYNQILIIPPVRNRYGVKSLVPVAPMSTTLLISFVKNARVQTIDVYLAVERICKPTKTKLVGKLDGGSGIEAVNMLFAFEDIQSAVYVMYKCHNSIVKGALLDIFFF